MSYIDKNDWQSFSPLFLLCLLSCNSNKKVSVIILRFVHNMEGKQSTQRERFTFTCHLKMSYVRTVLTLKDFYHEILTSLR